MTNESSNADMTTPQTTCFALSFLIRHSFVIRHLLAPWAKPFTRSFVIASLRRIHLCLAIEPIRLRRRPGY